MGPRRVGELMMKWHKAVIMSLLFEGLPNPKEIAAAQFERKLPMTKEEVLNLNLGHSEDLAVNISVALAEIFILHSIDVPFVDDETELDYHFEDRSLPFESIILQLECKCGEVNEIDSTSSKVRGSMNEIRCNNCGERLELKLDETLEDMC